MRLLMLTISLKKDKVMREIKFRAFDKENNEFITDYDTGKYSIVEIGNDYIHVIQLNLIDELINGEHEQYESTKLIEDSFEIMQYTGLKDSEGVEIYEGDVVETIYCYKEKHTGEIYFQPTRYNWSVKHSEFTNQDMFVYSRPDCSITVIGNIYESPELLEND